MLCFSCLHVCPLFNYQCFVPSRKLNFNIHFSCFIKQPLKGCLAGEISWVELFLFDRKLWPSALVSFWLSFSPAENKLCWGNWEYTTNLKMSKVLFWFFAKGDGNDFFPPILKPWAMFSLFLLHLLLFFPRAFFHSSPWCSWNEWYTQVWLDVLSPLHVSTAGGDCPFLPHSWLQLCFSGRFSMSTYLQVEWLQLL